MAKADTVWRANCRLATADKQFKQHDHEHDIVTDEEFSGKTTLHGNPQLAKEGWIDVQLKRVEVRGELVDRWVSFVPGVHADPI